MKLEKAIKVLNELKEEVALFSTGWKTKLKDDEKQAIETVLQALENKNKEITDMRETIVRVAKSLEKKGKYELSEYILAQIEATPTFTTWEDYTTWIPKKKIEDKIKYKKQKLQQIEGGNDYYRGNCLQIEIDILQELLKEEN